MVPVPGEATDTERVRASAEELVHAARPELRARHEQDAGPAVRDHGREVADRMVLQVAHDVRVHRVGADRAQQQGGAVGRLLRDVHRGDGAAGAGAVVHRDRGAPPSPREICAAIMRPMMSVLVPAAKGTTRRMGRSGQFPGRRPARSPGTGGGRQGEARAGGSGGGGDQLAALHGAFSSPEGQHRAPGPAAQRRARAPSGLGDQPHRAARLAARAATVFSAA